MEEDMNFKLDHIGFVTNDIEKFEYFWCKGLGFELVWESNIMPEKVKRLFGIERATQAMRYQKGDMIIEIHIFNPPLQVGEIKFDTFGINHVGLWVEDREKFIDELRERIGYVEVKKYYDPSGWWNLFIKDYDGNWIELRATL